MKNKTTPSKEQVVEEIIDIFVREIGFIGKEQVFPNSHTVKDFDIGTDDLSWFSEATVRHFDIKPTQEEWFADAGTIEEIANLVLRHLSKKN